jgi:hypothetical protein
MNTLVQKKTVLQKISQFFVMLLQRYLPDPFIFAIVLTYYQRLCAEPKYRKLYLFVLGNFTAWHTEKPVSLGFTRCA